MQNTSISYKSRASWKRLRKNRSSYYIDIVRADERNYLILIAIHI